MIEEIKRLLEEERFRVPFPKQDKWNNYAACIPIMHNRGKVYLQFCGWSINLKEDGTWYWEDTTGG